jgi:16S rRNA processing protein RimM
VGVVPLSMVESRFAPGSRVYLGEGEDRPLIVVASRPHQRRLLVVFEGIGDRTVAERLRGQYLFVPASEAPPLPDGEFWTHQLVGCRVETEDGRRLGALKEVAHTLANDVWVVAGDAGEALVPALKDVVRSVDVPGRRIVVRDVPGLTSP